MAQTTRISATVEERHDGRVIVVSGPAASGKTTIVNALRKKARAAGKTTDTIYSTDRNLREAESVERALKHSQIVFVERLTA